MYAFAIFFCMPTFVNLIFRLGSSCVFWWKGQESVKKEAGQFHGANVPEEQMRMVSTRAFATQLVLKMTALVYQFDTNILLSALRSFPPNLKQRAKRICQVGRKPKHNILLPYSSASSRIGAIVDTRVVAEISQGRQPVSLTGWLAAMFPGWGDNGKDSPLVLLSTEVMLFKFDVGDSF